MKRRDIIMHINYCEQGQTLSETCQKAAKWGFDGIEFRSNRKNKVAGETLTQYLNKVEEAAQAAGIEKVLFGSPGVNLTQSDADARKQEVENYIAFLSDANARFGTTLFNTFGGALLNPDSAIPYSDREKQGSGIATDAHYEQITEGFQEIGKFAESEGLTIAFETHGGYVHDLSEPTKRLIDAINSPAVGANFDYCNMLTFAQPPTLPDAITALGDKIYYVHLKNLYRIPTSGYAGNYVMTSLAAGQINNRDLLRQVFAAGYDGPVCIEAPRQGDREQFAQEDLAYTKALISELD